MSRIEEALEKANKLRESESPQKPQPFNAGKTSLPASVTIDNAYIMTLTQPESPIAEEYRKLKSIVIRATKADFLNTIMITSALDSEGKSLTAINLAVSLAQEIDHSILLIDADLRRPLIHDYFGLKPELGLSDYLTGQAELSDILIKTGIGNLTILPAGQRSKNPVELLSSTRMKTLVNEVKHRYADRYVIIDTPPVLPFAEAMAIGSFVDGVIFVVKEGYAQRRTIREAVNLIKDLNIIGVVFNAVSTENLEGHYSRYYYGYYGRKEK
jgi:exopolysaccharide/PEP-CTERM locus tyrosine autokinase